MELQNLTDFKGNESSSHRARDTKLPPHSILFCTSDIPEVTSGQHPLFYCRILTERSASFLPVIRQVYSKTKESFL